jgi:hypothetical protein
LCQDKKVKEETLNRSKDQGIDSKPRRRRDAE